MTLSPEAYNKHVVPGADLLLQMEKAEVEAGKPEYDINPAWYSDHTPSGWHVLWVTCLWHCTVLVMFIDQWISDGFSVILLGGVCSCRAAVDSNHEVRLYQIPALTSVLWVEVHSVREHPWCPPAVQMFTDFSSPTLRGKGKEEKKGGFWCIISCQAVCFPAANLHVCGLHVETSMWTDYFSQHVRSSTQRPVLMGHVIKSFVFRGQPSFGISVQNEFRSMIILFHFFFFFFFYRIGTTSLTLSYKHKLMKSSVSVSGLDKVSFTN